MYLSGLAAVVDMGVYDNPNSGIRVVNPTFADTADLERRCAAMGGVLVAHPNGNSISYTCSIPDKVPEPPSAPSTSINVSVPTQTQVSPQISPQFVQQQQPQNSPVSAAAGQNLAPPVPQSSYQAPDVQASTPDLTTLFQPSPSPVPSSAPSAPAQPVYVSVPGASGSVPAATQPETVVDNLTKYAPAVLAVVAVLGFMSTRKKGRS